MTTASVAELPHELKTALLHIGSSMTSMRTTTSRRARLLQVQLGIHRFIAKVDCYDKALKYSSKGPSGPEKTTRVNSCLRKTIDREVIQACRGDVSIFAYS
jgi:hypothetical protein